MTERLLVSQREACELIGLNVRKLRTEVYHGRLRYVQVGARWKFQPSELRRWMTGAPREAPKEVQPEFVPLVISATALLGRARSGAKLRNKLFHLTIAHIEEMITRAAGRCEVSGVPFSDVEICNARPFAPSIDRIDSALGYTPENCRLVCFAVNIALHQWGDAVLRRIAEGVVGKNSG